MTLEEMIIRKMGEVFLDLHGRRIDDPTHSVTGLATWTEYRFRKTWAGGYLAALGYYPLHPGGEVLTRAYRVTTIERLK